LTVIANYEVQVADLLHDVGYVIWTTTQLDRYINEARRQLVADTGCLRSLQTLVLTQNVEAYQFGQVSGGLITNGGSGYVTPTISFAGGGGSGVAATLGVTSGAVTSITFSSLGSGYTSPPVPTINPVGGGAGAAITIGAISVQTYDVLDFHTIWGAERYRLGWRPWSRFSMEMRSWVTLQSRPMKWAVYGDTTVYVGPLPDQAYLVDLDTIVLPVDLSGSTADPIPALYQDPIKFYAAYIAKYNQQMYGEAATFKKEYGNLVAEKLGAYIRRIPNPYNNGGS
jgi:hypothetical protein